MNDAHFLLIIAHISALELFAFIMLYPLFKDLAKETIKEDAFLAEILAFLLIISALTCTFYLAYALITFCIGALIILISMFSGLSLIALSRIHRVNLLLFALPITLSTLLYIIENLAMHGMKNLALTFNIINELIYLIGVGEGAVKYLPIFFKEFYRNSHTEALTALFITICILTVALQWTGLEVPYTLRYMENTSTIAFIAGGSIGYAILWMRKWVARTL